MRPSALITVFCLLMAVNFISGQTNLKPRVLTAPKTASESEQLQERSLSLTRSLDDASLIRYKEIPLYTAQPGLKMSYLDIPDTETLEQILQKLNDENYPLILLHNDVFARYVELLIDYDAMVFQYDEMKRTYTQLDSLNRLAFAEKDAIIGYSNERIQVLKQLNEDLRSEHDRLNGLLTDARAIGEQQVKGKVRKNLWVGVLGGAVGFAFGVLIMEFATN